MNGSTTIELSELLGVDLLAVASDPVRWRLLAALSDGERCVCELQPVAAVSAPTLSHHLRVLREAGLILSSRRGRWITYRLATDTLERLRAALPFGAATTPHEP